LKDAILIYATMHHLLYGDLPKKWHCLKIIGIVDGKRVVRMISEGMFIIKRTNLNEEFTKNI